MKQFSFVTIIVFAMTNLTLAQPHPFEKDVVTIDAIIQASYEVVSGEKGAPRQWERDQYLHHPTAVYSFFDRQKQEQVTMTLSEFHQETDNMVRTTAFYESEINREVRRYGNIAQVWSTYETRLEKDGPVERRGINSLQLIYDNDRWYIISWIFFGEDEANPIPETFDKN